MKIKEKSNALCVLECICHIAFSYPVIALIWYMFANGDGLKITVFLFAAFSEVMMYMFRRHFHKRWEFYVAIAVYIIVLVMLLEYIGGIYLFAGAVITVLCIIIVLFSSVADFEVPSTGIATLLIIIGIGVWLAATGKLLVVVYIFEAVYILALIIYKNLKNADDFIWENRRTAFLSVGQIKDANYLITFILGIIILVVSGVWALLFSPILNLLRQPILQMLSRLFGTDIVLPEMEQEQEMPKLEEPVIGELVKDKSSGSIVAVIFVTILGIASLIMLIAFIVHIVRQLSLGTMDGDIREYIIPFRKEEVSSVEQEVEEIVDDRPAKKIRKIYKKKIKSSLKKNSSILKASTPNEQKKLAGLSGEGTEEFVELYHKARYSNEECTEDDVEKMRSYK